MNWMATAWSKVKASTIKKCFAAGGTSAGVAEVQDEDDPFDDLEPELQDLIEQAAPGCSTDTETFIWSEELPVYYSICKEQQLLDAISNQSHQEIVIEDAESKSENKDSESSSAGPHTSTIKSFAEVVTRVQDIHYFLVQHGQVSLASDFSCV